MEKHIRLTLVLLSILGLMFLSVKCDFEVRETSLMLSPSKLPTTLLLTSSKCSSSNAFYGAVMGRLFLINGQPAVGSILYLGEYVGLETSSPVVILDISRHPHTQVGEEGTFCFSEVPPGRYGLIVWDGVESILLPDPTTGHSLLIEIKSKETVDVGILYSPIP